MTARDEIEFSDDETRCQYIVTTNKNKLAQCRGFHTRDSDFCVGHERTMGLR